MTESEAIGRLSYMKNKVDVALMNSKHEKGHRLYDDVQGTADALQMAIEIVKRGCVSDDVCEWHCDMYGRYHTECHILADNDPLEYTYCPYCGKKIRMVEQIIKDAYD